MNFKPSNKSSSICRAVLGPTNTGKTYYALERMISYKSGVIGVPLRLLAREIYDRLVSLKGAETLYLIPAKKKYEENMRDIGSVRLRPCQLVSHLSFQQLMKFNCVQMKREDIYLPTGYYIHVDNLRHYFWGRT